MFDFRHNSNYNSSQFVAEIVANTALQNKVIYNELDKQKTLYLNNLFKRVRRKYCLKVKLLHILKYEENCQRSTKYI